MAAAPATIHLTFDDGPDPRWTPGVLGALRRAGARASFFVMAPRARAQARIVREMLAEGHGVELHCRRHLRHTRCGREEIARDTDAALADLAGLGVRPARWRTPWGAEATWTRELADERGLRLCGWSADTRDWHGDPAAWLLSRVAAAVRPGAIVLMHDGLGPGARRGGCEETVRLVGPLLELAGRRGLRAVPVGES